jgi:plasmid stabilization system protein ParE
MRPVRYAQSAEAAFQTLLAEGAAKFGLAVADEKRRLLQACVRTYLAEYPHHGLRTPGQTFRHYPVSDTPFTVVFEYDDAELRVLFIVHQRADQRRLDRVDVTW